MPRKILAVVLLAVIIAGCDTSYNPEYNNDDLAQERGENQNFFQRLFSSPRPERDARYIPNSSYSGFTESPEADYGSRRNELTSDIKVQES